MGPPISVPQPPPEPNRAPLRPVPRGQPNPPGPHFGDWLRGHQNLPLGQQMKLLEQEPTFQKLPPREQDRLRERLQRFNSLPPDQRQRRLEQLQRLEQLTPEQRQRAESILDTFRVLPPERRQMIGRAARTLAVLPPDQQQRLLQSDQMRRMFSDQERDMLRGILDLHIGPAAPSPEPPAGPPPGFE
jgi:hypothetical protein